MDQWQDMSPYGRMFLALVEINMHGMYRTSTDKLVFNCDIAFSGTKTPNNATIPEYLDLLMWMSQGGDSSHAQLHY